MNSGDRNFCGIVLSVEDYDDELALRAFVAKHARDLMTPLERRVTEYAIPLTSGMDDHKCSRLYDFLERRDGHVDDADVLAAFAEPREVREANAVNRIVNECADQIPINRCLSCERLTRTPVAQQCLWCGHDWHT